MRDGEGVRRHRDLAFRLDFLISADIGMAGVFSGHQSAARRRAHGVPGVCLGETHSFRRKAVNIWRLYQFLAKAAEIAVAQVVRQNENDIWPRRHGSGGCDMERQKARKEEETAHE